MYELGSVGELRYNQDGQRWSRAQFSTLEIGDVAASQEWAIAGRRSIAVALLIPTQGPPANFSECQATLAARGLVRYLLDQGPIQVVNQA